jgi:anaphase-promoting complex subunit 1
MFNSTSARHLVCKIRKVTEDEAESTAFLHDGSNLDQSSIGGFSNINQQYSIKASTSRHNISGRHTPNASGISLVNLSNPHHSSVNYRMSLASFADSGLHKNSISMMARKIGECNPSKALVPDLILEQLWSENNGNWNEYHEMATKGFLHTDFISQQYLCFLLSRSFKLNLLQIEHKRNNLQKPIFGSVTTITAKDAVCLPKMNMIVALLPCGTLMLYSGPVAVGKIYVGGILSNLTTTSSVAALSTPAFPKRSSILPNIPSPMVDQKLTEQFHMLSPVQPLHSNQNQLRLNNCSSIRDPVGNRVSVGFTNGKIYRFQLPFMCENPVVRKMLIALRQVLPKESLKVFVRWYSIKNSPGTRDLNLKREFELFKTMLYELIGRPHEISNYSSSTTVNAKKRRKNEENGADSDWEYLLNVTEEVMMDKKNEEDGDHDMIQNYHSDAPLFPHIPAIFYTMHLLYEDFKMDLTMKSEMKLIAEFLCQLSTDFKLEKFRYHYIKDNPKLCNTKSKREISTSGSEILLRKELIGSHDPISVFHEIAKLTCKSKFDPYPFIPNVNNLSKDIYEILAVIFEKVKMPNDASVLIKVCDNQMTSSQNKSNFQPGSSTIQKVVIDTMIRKGITRKDMERLPIAIHYMISQTLETVRLNPPVGSCAKAFKLLLRPELFTHAAFKRNKKSIKEVEKVQQESSLSLRIQTQPDVIAKSEKALVEDDGMEQIDTKLLRLRFPDDLRINDVKKFLNSSKPVIIDIKQAPNMSDHDFIEEQEKQLFALCTRTMALPVGRGMFTFRTYYPVLTETLPIPKLCLSGKEINRGASVELQSIELPANMSVWPQFHNGVASALRIATDPSEIDPAYIMYNKPKDPEMPPSYAGFLMALGLTSSLKSLSDTYIYDYLVKSEELLSVGLILGMAASYRGTMDTKVTRMLSIHIESLLPPTAIELDVPHNVQVASLLGIGLLYQNSNKRFIAEALLQEINRPPGEKC